MIVDLPLHIFYNSGSPIAHFCAFTA